MQLEQTKLWRFRCFFFLEVCVSAGCPAPGPALTAWPVCDCDSDCDSECLLWFQKSVCWPGALLPDSPRPAGSGMPVAAAPVPVPVPVSAGAALSGGTGLLTGQPPPPPPPPQGIFHSWVSMMAEQIGHPDMPYPWATAEVSSRKHDSKNGRGNVWM